MKVPVLMYHEIGGADAYSVGAETFERQMRYLGEHGFTAVTPEELRAGAGGARRPVMITFDDGFASDLSVACPVMERYGLRGVSFITTGYVGRDRYLTWDGARRLRDRGFSLQSHTHNHLLLGETDRDTVRGELALSRELIRKHLQVAARALSLPGGSVPEDLHRLARLEGYEAVYSSLPGVNRDSDADRGFFKRALIARRTTFDTFVRLVEGDRSVYLKEAAAYHARRYVKKLVGAGNYHRVWKRFYKESPGKPG